LFCFGGGGGGGRGDIEKTSRFLFGILFFVRRSAGRYRLWMRRIPDAGFDMERKTVITVAITHLCSGCAGVGAARPMGLLPLSGTVGLSHDDWCAKLKIIRAAET